MARVVVVGAGLSGLAVAFRLKAALPGVRLAVLEPRPAVGGNVGTLDRDGFRVETGPNGFQDNKPGTVGLCRALGLGDRLIAASDASRTNRFVFLRDRLYKLPGSPLGVLTTPLLTPAGKMVLFREPFRGRPHRRPADESVAAFARRRFGREAADIFIDALVTGVHAGDPERLSVAAAFPRMAAFERDHGSVVRGVLASAKQRKRDAVARGETPAPTRMWSFRDGLRVLTDALRDRLGDAVITSVGVKRVERTTSRGACPPGSDRSAGSPGWAVHGDGRDRWHADAVVLTCPAFEQAAVLADLDPALAAEMAGIRTNKVAVVALGYRQADVPNPPDGFGYIAPQNTRRDVLGVQWCSSIFPDRAPPGFVLWRALCGGVNRPDVFDRSDDELVRACDGEMRLAMGVRGGPAFAEVVRWPRAIPQYEVGHPARVERIEAAVAGHAGLFVTGNSYRGVAMNDVTEQAEVVAGRVAAYLSDGRRTPGSAP